MNGLQRYKPSFIRSAAHFRDLPEPSGREYCIVGRSNVGKSSFLNHVLGKKGLARVSKQPGRTQLANLFRLDEETIWVDLPGYGYAKASHGEKDRWSRLIGEYCERRANLAGVIWLLDARHPGMSADKYAYEWLLGLELPMLPVYTKVDKLGTNQRNKNLAAYRRLFPLAGPGVSYSILHNESRERFWEAYDKWEAGGKNEK